MDEINKTIDYYNKNSEQYIANTLHLDMGSLYRPFIEQLKPGSKILDAGCGPGRDVKFFHSSGFQVVGIDASEEMVNKAKQVTGLEILQLDFSNIKFDNEFDAIWACASLLHIPRNDMKEVLFRFSKALKNNGIFYMSFKYGVNEEIRNGRFFSNYTEVSFTQLLSSFPEFKTIKMWITPDIRPNHENEYWLNALLKKLLKNLS